MMKILHIYKIQPVRWRDHYEVYSVKDNSLCRHIRKLISVSAYIVTHADLHGALHNTSHAKEFESSPHTGYQLPPHSSSLLAGTQSLGLHHAPLYCAAQNQRDQSLLDDHCVRLTAFQISFSSHRPEMMQTFCGVGSKL